jgi:ankyrin repeat protein
MDIIFKKDFPTSTIRKDWLPFHFFIATSCPLSKQERKKLMKDNMKSLITPNNAVSTNKVTVAHVLACKKKVNMEIAEDLFGNILSLGSQADEDGFLPLHYAAYYCQDKQLLQYLIQQNPKAMGSFTKSNSSNNDNKNTKYIDNLPIHLSINNKNLLMFSTLLEASKESIAEQ